MATFVPYPKVPTSLEAWALSDHEVRQAATIQWVATEKIHGAHLNITLTKDSVVVGTRKRFVDPDEAFFAYPRALGPLYAALRELSALVQRAHGGVSAVVYGELFGGAYPHPQVAAVPDVQAVQTGVHYAPDVCFAAFDLGLHRADGTVSLLPVGEAVVLFAQAGVPVVPVCGIGSLTELLALSPRLQTRVPAMLGLPDLPRNWAEGLVIKPYSAALALPGPTRRVALVKHKHPAFAETAYHQARPWPRVLPQDHDSALQRAETLALAMLTTNRIDSAISKIGWADTTARRRQVADEVLGDLRDELECDHGGVLVAMSQEERALLWSAMADAVATAIAEHGHEPTLDPAQTMVALALAFIRGRLPAMAAATDAALVAAAKTAGLRLNKFKRKSGPPRVTAVLSLLEGLRPRRLLDIGAGRGAFLWPLVDRFPALPVTAVDTLPHRVRDIQAVRAGGIATLEGRLADAQALAFDDACFDVVTILEVLEHLQDPLAAAKEVVRVATRFVVASVPSHPDDNPEHIRLFTAASLTTLFEDAGAARVQIHYVRDHMIAVVRCRS